MGKVSRRKFLGTVGAAETRQGGKGADRKNRVAPGPNLREDVRDLVDKTRFIDTHEHLWPEGMMAAPASKVLTFGGDYRPVEPVVGHAAIARHGVTQAIAELIEEGWLPESDAPDLIQRIMNGNALDLFPYESAVNNWRNV